MISEELADRADRAAFTISAASIAQETGGELLGDAEVQVSGVAGLDLAGAHDLSLLVRSRYIDDYPHTRAGVVLIRPEFRDVVTAAPARIVVEDPAKAILTFLSRMYPELQRPAGVHETAVIGRGAVLGSEVAVGPYVVVGDRAQIGTGTVIGAHTVVGDDVIVGAECHLHPHVSLYPGAVLGRGVVVHSGCRIAGDGFGYQSGPGGHTRVRHVGRCVIEDDVEIGANSCIDRGSIGDTVIGAGTKIDNLVHIAHNVRVGKNCLIIAQVGIAGSCRVGDGVVIAGQVGIAGHVRVGAGATLGAQAGVIRDVPPRETWSGFPARPHRESMKAHSTLYKLSHMIKELEELLEERK